MTFARPLWLLALILLPVIWLQWTRFAPSVPHRQRRWLRIVRPVIYLCLILALAGMEWKTARPESDIIVLIDASDSVVASDQVPGEAYADALQDHMRSGDRLAVVVFGRDATVVKAYDEPQFVTALRLPDGSATNIERALRIAYGLSQPERNTRIVLISDGHENLGSARAVLPDFVEHNIAIDVVPLSHTPGDEVVIEAFIVPTEVQHGEPFVARAVIASTVETGATAYLFRNGAIVEARQMNLEPGRSVASFDLTEAVGVATYEVRVEAIRDTLLENNVGQALVTTTGPARVLLLAGDLRESGPLHAALQAQEIAVDHQTITQASLDPGTLIGYATIVLHNVSSTQLSPVQLKAIDDFVRQTGGGLIIVGGNRSFGAGAYSGTLLEDMSPLQIEGPEHLMIPSLAMVLVVDKSGSMNESVDGSSLSKLDLAKEAIIGVAQNLESRDLLGLLAFDNQPQWTIPLQPLQQEEWVIAQTLRLVADGGTNVYPALEEARQALTGVQATVKHIILLSDGHTLEADFGTLTKRIAAQGITVSTIGVGDADQDLLAQIAQWGGGRYYYTDDAYRIPYIFATETRLVSPPQYVERLTQPILEDGSGFFTGIPLPFPTVAGYAVTYPKESATVHLVADDGLPLMASWRYGLGRVVAYTSGLDTAWGAEWPVWPFFAPFWAQTVRWSMRPTTSLDMQAAMNVRHGQGTIWLDALNSDGQYINFLTPQATIVDPKGEATNIVLEQTNPGRYEAVFPAEAVGTWTATVTTDGAAIPQPLVASATQPYPEEYRVIYPDERLLSDLTTATDGLFIHTIDDMVNVLAQPTRKREAASATVLLTLLALVMFLVDLGIRYVPVGTVDALRDRVMAVRMRQRETLASSATVAEDVLRHRTEETSARPTDSKQAASRAAHTYLARRKKERQADKDSHAK